MPAPCHDARENASKNEHEVEVEASERRRLRDGRRERAPRWRRAAATRAPQRTRRPRVVAGGDDASCAGK